MGKRTQSKSGTKKKRASARGRPGRDGLGAGSEATGGGMMQGMVRGMRQVVGVEKSRQGSSAWSNVLWMAALAAAVAWVVSRW